MDFRVSCELEYWVGDPTSFLFALQCMRTGGQQPLHEQLSVQPFIQVEELTSGLGGNRLSRFNTINPGSLKLRYQADVRTSFRLAPAFSQAVSDPGRLSPEVIPFLFPSRYCQSDSVRNLAMDLFGNLTKPHQIAAGVSDWIFKNIAYVGGSSGESSSALNTLEQRQGVCRDFAHLGITFCRALNLPARYLTCYAYQLNPQDFHACFEVFIDGWWYVFDATRLAPMNGLVKIATGRDAADVAICTIFGNPTLISSFVSCGCQDPGFTPITPDSLAAANQVIALL